MHVLVSGYNHYGFIDAIARGFAALPEVEATAFRHPHVPAAKAHRGWLGKRLYHAHQVRRLNRDLLRAAAETSPDVIVCIEGSTLLPAAVSELERHGPVVLWALDSLRRIELATDVLDAFTHVFFFEPTDREIWPEGRYLPVGFDPASYHRLDNAGEPVYDLVWVGSAHEDRLPRLDAIARTATTGGQRFAAFGRFYKPRDETSFRHRFPALHAAIERNEAIPPATANHLYNQSVAALNLHAHDPLSQGLNPRTFEVPGAGAVLLTDPMAELPGFFAANTDVLVFRDPAELRRRLDWLFTDSQATDRRRELADRGHDRAHREHTFASRARQLLTDLA